MPFSLADMPTGSLLALAQLARFPCITPRPFASIAQPETRPATRQRDPSCQSGGYVGLLSLARNGVIDGFRPGFTQGTGWT